jgi:hypothetical protein
MPKPTISFGLKDVYTLSDGLGLWGVHAMRIKVHLGSYNQEGRTSCFMYKKKSMYRMRMKKSKKGVFDGKESMCTKVRIKCTVRREGNGQSASSRTGRIR